jgi:hypothetical protein
MTIEEFDKQGWVPGMMARHHRDGNEYQIASCDFEEKLVGLLGMVDGVSDDFLSWVRCENVTITGG